MYIYRVSQKKDMGLIDNNCFVNKIQTFTSNHLKKEVLILLFDALLRLFCETHRIKGCDKNVSLTHTQKK